MEGLSREEIAEFARVFATPLAARHVLEEAGWPPERIPGWQPEDAMQFWREVAKELAAGRVTNGRHLLFAAAAEGYSGNHVFVAGTGTLAARLRQVPPVDLLPQLPVRFVPREVDAERVGELLRDPAAGQVVALVGMGGAGKSTLAAAVAQDRVVAEAFPDGVAWVGIGQSPVVANRLAKVLTLFGDPAPVRDAEEGIRRLRALLTGARALIVLDDVWDVSVLDAFDAPSGVRLLVTCRSKDRYTLYTGTTVHDVAELDHDTARRMLASYAQRPVGGLPPIADELLARCGGLALALALVGAMVATNRGRWERVAERLRLASLIAVPGTFRGYPHPTLFAAIDASVAALPAEQALRFQELAVFGGRSTVPEALVIGLWQTTSGLGELAAADLISQLEQRSLVQIDPESGAVRVHDLLVEYTRGSLTKEQVRTLHGQLATWLLNRWGGLEAAPPLPRLPEVPARDGVDRYGLTNLVTHLIAADDPAAVDQLLAAERTTPDGRPESVWYATHENQDTTATYLTDLDAAWHYAGSRQTTDPQVFVRLASYALILGSITSIAANMRAWHLTRLVEARMWSPARALTFARAIPDPARRAEALITLAPHQPQDQRPAVLRQALNAAIAITGSYERAWALTMLAPHLPYELLGFALNAATAFDLPAHRARVLTALAPCLPEGQRAELLEQALNAATAIDHSDERDRALMELAPHLPDGQHWQSLGGTAVVDWPESTVHTPIQLGPDLLDDLRGLMLNVAIGAFVDQPEDRARVLTALAPHLPEDQRTELLEKALNAATTINNPKVRAELLMALAEYMPGDRRSVVFGQALDAATAIPWPDDQSEMLTALVPHLPDELLGPALNLATAIDAPTSRSGVVTEHAPHAVEEWFGQALKSLEQALIESPEYRAKELTTLAAGLSGDQRAVALEQALNAAAAIDQPDRRAEALTVLAPHLPNDQQPAVLISALAAAARTGRAAVANIISSVLTAGTVDPDVAGVGVAEAVLRVQRWWP
ncbi:hypothetical protein I6A60_23110 [Frankia sp. AgB1.9]|uniref:NB-ARC domain-containing protein n=1 Tax=unclassified Frankia TaxID=2632575 RepID=UPI0019321BF7|nr:MULTISPECIES: NB-ARC domain-containing protein [unclassified Frankia]MBL7489668.1 hypothetical protein [Frankia sp. AgW1.1]MBL7550737.1 hypothetical protein [Frankia sp. AgB1.9]MBL7624354.1 hypothetical protein [Frankia sp. AgB1.8]